MASLPVVVAVLALLMFSSSSLLRFEMLGMLGYRPHHGLFLPLNFGLRLWTRAYGRS